MPNIRKALSHLPDALASIQTRLLLGQFDEALRAAGELQDATGRDNFYIEFMDHGLKSKQVTSRSAGHYEKTERAAARRNDFPLRARRRRQNLGYCVLCIQLGSTLDEPGRFKFDGTGYYLKSAEEMRELFKDIRSMRQYVGNRRTLQCHVRTIMKIARSCPNSTARKVGMRRRCS